MNTLVAALDCGTTVIKAGLFGLDGLPRGVASVPCPVQTGAGGQIEHSPRVLLERVLVCLREAVARARVRPGAVAAVAVCNQRATVICTGRDGRALGQAISWQDLRGAGRIEALRRRITDRRYYAITGLPNHPIFSLGKILWIQHQAPDRFRQTARFVLVHDYVLRGLGCEDYITDWSNASLTGLLEVDRLRWSPELLELAGLDGTRLPTLVPSAQVVGRLSRRAAARTGLRAGTPLVSGGGDQQCAGIGAGAVKAGVVEVTLGTAAAPLVYAARPVRDPWRRLTCCAHAVPGAWEVEGLQSSAGASLDWLRRVMGRARGFSEEILRSVGRVRPGAGGVLFYPYLAGASAPHWYAQATGALVGLRQAHGQRELIRAVMEGVSLETREILDIFAELELPISELRLTGGCSRLEAWDQIQADIFGKPVCTLENPDASLLGAAVLGACGVGAFGSVPAAAGRMVRVRRRYRPRAGAVAEYERVYRRYREVRESFQRGGIFARLAERMEIA